jgi:hypothetical protein
MHDLFFLVSHHNADFMNPSAKDTLQLVVENRAVVNSNETFWTFAVN